MTARSGLALRAASSLGKAAPLAPASCSGSTGSLGCPRAGRQLTGGASPHMTTDETYILALAGAVLVIYLIMVLATGRKRK